MANLIERLTEAATVAIENEHQGLNYGIGRLRGIILELEITHNGGIVAGRCYIERVGKVLRKETAA